MIEIRIRDIEEAEPAHLADVPFAELDRFISRLQQDGVYVIGNDTTHEIKTQWVRDSLCNEAYFEIIVGEENE